MRMEDYMDNKKMEYDRFNNILIARGLRTRCYEDIRLPEPEGGAAKYMHEFPDAALKRYYEEGLNIYPNPGGEDTKIYLRTRKTQVASIEIIDLSGRQVFVNSEYKTNTEFSMSREGIPAGIYLIRASSSDGKTYFGKWLRQ